MKIDFDFNKFDEEAKKSEHFCLACHNWYKKQIETLIAHSQNCGVSEEEIEKETFRALQDFCKIEECISDALKRELTEVHKEYALAIAKALSSLPLRKEVGVEEVEKVLTDFLIPLQHRHVCAGFDCSECTPNYNALAQAIIDHLKGRS